MHRYTFADEFDGSICVETTDSFYVEIDGEHGLRFNREQLREMRSAIEDALNTSEDELSDVDF